MTFSAKKYSLVQTPSFEKELNEILNYISFKLNEPNTSKKFYNNEVDNHTRASFYSTYFSWKSKLFKSLINSYKY